MGKPKDVKLPKLDAICSTSDFKKELQHILFEDGYAVASDGFVLVRWKHKAIQDITVDPGCGMKAIIHHTQFKCLRKLPGPYQITKDGITAYGGRVLFPSVEGVTFPKYELAFQFQEPDFPRECVANFKTFARVQEVFKDFIDPGFGVVLCEKKSCHVVYPYHGEDFIAIIMKMAHLVPNEHDPEALYKPIKQN